jgi:hypothetical protein
MSGLLDTDSAVDQRADIDVRHVFHHGLNLPEELEMLRHKLRVLQDVVDHHGMSPCFSLSVRPIYLCLSVSGCLAWPSRSHPHVRMYVHVRADALYVCAYCVFAS